jgi:hypothetical protein
VQADAAPAPARNLLSNPGFEKGLPGHDWMPAGWDTSEAGLSTVFFGRDTLMVHSGTHAVTIANTSTVYPMAHNWSQIILVGREAWGKEAVFSVWTRSNGLNGRAYMMVQAYRDTITKMSVIWAVDRESARRRFGVSKLDDPAMDLGWKRVQFDDPMTDWVRREARVYIPVGVNVIFVRCGLFGTGQVVYDDASLTLEPASPVKPVALGQNVFTDPGFEEGALSWEQVVPPFEGARLERDSTTVHSGRYSMHALGMRDGLTQTRMGLTQVIPGRVLAGKRVRLTAWLKADSLRSTAYLKIYAQGPRIGVQQSPGTELLSGSFDWKQLSIEWDVPAGADQVWPWALFNAPAEGEVWFDDLELTVLGPAASATKPR